jgi:hypothetical protein
MTLPPMEKVVPNFSTFGSPRGLRARSLQLDVQRACADAAPVHGKQNLDVANGVEVEALRDPCLYQLEWTSNSAPRRYC